MAVARNRSTKQAASESGIAGTVPAIDAAPAASAAKRTPAPKMVPANPEKKPTGEARRKRLSKAFERPLDKKFKKEALIRVRFTMLASEYALLVDLKKRLGEQGVAVKKSELIRAGLSLLGNLDENDVKAILAKLTAVA